MQNHIRTNQINLKTASNIIQFDLCNIVKILKIGAHNWNIMYGNFVWRTEKVVGQIVRHLKIFISRLGDPHIDFITYSFIPATNHCSLLEKSAFLLPLIFLMFTIWTFKYFHSPPPSPPNSSLLPMALHGTYH